jgi:hypothetical protein
MKRWVLPTIILIVSLVVLLVSFLPAPLMSNRFDVDAAVIYAGQSTPAPQFIHFQIFYPQWIRLDESGSFLLKINLDSAEMEDLRGWQARLEMNGVVISPHGESRQRAVAGRETVFRWNIKPYKPDAGRGTIWVYQVRDNGLSEGEARLILAHPFEVRVLNGAGAFGWMLLRVVSGGGVAAALLWLWGNRSSRVAMQENIGGAAKN